MPNETIPAGWYPDPAGDATKLRYWDGQTWTAQTQAVNTYQAPDNYNIPVVPQPVYAPNQQMPMYYAAAPVNESRKGFAIAGLILGICTVPLGCLAYFAFIPGILAVIFGILGIKSPQRVMAIIGIILGAVGLVLGILMTILVVYYAANPDMFDSTRVYDISF